MKLSYHPAVQRDVNGILSYYRSESGESLADRFFDALSICLDEIARHPERFPPYLGHHRFRRAKLGTFPHIVVFRILYDKVRVTVIKHEKRHPSFGMSRE